MSAQTWLMRRMGFVPPDFEGEWRRWILAVSFGTGIVVDKNGSPTVVECLGTVSFRDSLKLNVYEDGTFRVVRSATATDRKTIADYARGHEFIERLGLNDAS